jgi:hypothetical protein
VVSATLSGFAPHIPNDFVPICVAGEKTLAQTPADGLKIDLVLSALRWPVLTRPSLAEFDLTAEVDRTVTIQLNSACGVNFQLPR